MMHIDIEIRFPPGQIGADHRDECAGRALFAAAFVASGRCTGFERRQKPPDAPNPRAASREYAAFPQFYADKARGAAVEGGTLDEGHCVGPIAYRGEAAVLEDVQRLRRAAGDRPCEDVFVCAVAPSYIAATVPNEYYPTHEEYEQALADAMRQEYRAIIDAGAVLQIDDPRLITQYNFAPDLKASTRHWITVGLEVLRWSD